MKIEIIRTTRLKHSVDGEMVIDGIKVCHTVENAVWCLPPGRYRVEIVYIRSMAIKMPCLFSVDDNQPKAMVMMGNGVFSLRCANIIVGEQLVPGCVKKSAAAFNVLYERLRKSLARGHTIDMTIVE